MVVDNLSGQATGQANPVPQTASAKPQEPQSQETKPLDEARVIELAEQIARRTAQSLVDKAEYRISQKAQDQIKALELNKSVLGLDDQQVQTAKQKIIMDELTATPQEQQASYSPELQGQPQIDPVHEANFIRGLFTSTETKVEVTPTDPEFADFQKVYSEKFNDPSMEAMLAVTRAAEKASSAKKARLENKDTFAQARVVNAGSSADTPSYNPTRSALDILEEAHLKRKR